MSSGDQAAPPGLEVPRRTKIWRGIWMTAAAAGSVAVVVFLLKPHIPAAPKSDGAPVHQLEVSEPVRAVSTGLISISAQTPLHSELTVVEVSAERTTQPLISVSGTIMARVREGEGSFEERWQFATTELSSLYADWLRVSTEIEFNKSQLEKTKELATAETEYLESNVRRLKSLTSGTVPEKDILQAKAALLQAQLQRAKDIFTADSTYRTAVKQKAAIERNLSRSGIEPVVFGQAAEHMVLVAANVPESEVSRIQLGQSCEVRFYGYPDVVFPAHVEAMSSTLTPERRTLRVLFDVTDEKDVLKPGMFAEVGLGTDERSAIRIPATALLHIGRQDYVLVESESNQWRVTEVRLGEIHDERCEVLEGLQNGDRIISRGAILLKTLAAKSLSLPDRIAGKP